jgi:hypothetical protein
VMRRGRGVGGARRVVVIVGGHAAAV